MIVGLAVLIGIAAEIGTRVSRDDDIDGGTREDRIRAWICGGTDEWAELGGDWVWVLHGGEKIGFGLGEQRHGVRVSEQR